MFARSLASPYGILIVFPAIVSSVGLFLTLSAGRALRSSNLEMARDRMKDQAALVAAHLEAALDKSDPVLDELRVVVSASPSAGPAENVAKPLRHLLSGRRGITFVSVSYPDGTFQGSYLDGGEILFQDSRVVGAGSRVRRYAYASDGAISLRKEETTQYDPRKRDFYALAVRTGRRSWTRPYPFFGTGYTGVTRTEPVFDTNARGERELRAVLTVDFDVHTLSSVLADGELPEVHSLLYSADGTLLAYPEGRARIERSAHKDRTLHYRDLADPRLDGFFAAPERTNGTEPFAFETEGTRYLAAVAPITDDPTLGWSLAYLVPEQVFLKSLEVHARQSFTVAGVALLVALAVSIWFARLVVRVRREAADAREEAKRASDKARDLGSYRLIRCLGRGGMGEVWLGEHKLLARQAAIKLIREEAGRPLIAEAHERFRREAQSIAALRSRNTIELYDYGVAEDGTFFYVMELLDGVDLETLVGEHGPQPPARVVSLLSQACRSLAEAHEAGLVHRDVKPANLFVCRVADELDVVKVLDFGLVRSTTHEDESVSTTGETVVARRTPSNEATPDDAESVSPSRLTRAENVMGTPDFIAPEQALGQEVDGRADLYALGCVAFWLLTGRVLFPRNSALLSFVAHVHEAPPDLRELSPFDVPDELVGLVARCLAKSPDDRPATAHELQSELLAIPIAPRDTWTESAARRWWEEHRPKTSENRTTSETIVAHSDEFGKLPGRRIGAA